MRLKHINLFDLLFYGGLALIATVLSIVFAFFQESWDVGKVLVMIAVPLAFIGIALAVLLGQYFSRPDWTTEQGMLVWSKDIPFFDDEAGRRILDKFLDSFANRLPRLMQRNCGFCTFGPQAVRSLFLSTKLQWTTKRISLMGLGWSVKDKAGLQQGFNIVVHWNGKPLTETALTHELMHLVRQKLVSKAIDYKHEDRAWWAIVKPLNKAIETDVPSLYDIVYS